LRSAANEDVRLTISDVTGREIRSLVGTKNAGLNRVQWDLRAGGAGGRGRGQGGATAQAAPQAEAAAPTTPPAQPAAPQPGGRGQAAPAPAGAAAPAQGGGGGGRGRGGFQGPPVAPGSYLVKLMMGDKEIGRKTIVVEPDSTFLQ